MKTATSVKTASAWSTNPVTEEAVRSSFKKLINDLSGKPDWIMIYSSADHDCSNIKKIVKKLFPGIPFHGSTSCMGVMTEEGFHSAEGTGLGMFGIRDSSGTYSTGGHKNTGDPVETGKLAAENAIRAAGKNGEKPQFVWLTCAPGYEEEIIRGIENVVGPDIPIAGGSSADNTIEGNWKQFSGSGVYSDGVVVTAIFSSTRIHYTFWNGYYPGDEKGKITSCSKRTIHTIDGRPAAEVYNEWTGGAIQDSLRGGTILNDTTLHPIGRPLKKFSNLKFYCLSHPEAVISGGKLRLFTDVEEGEEIVLMKGTRTRLINRAAIVAKSAMRKGEISPERIAGALIIYCAGCMLTVKENMPEVVSHINDALVGNPFLGAFTFGEQGMLIDGMNHHGNLMISVLLFEQN